MSSDPVLLEYDDGIATITLNQPDRRNALSPEVQSGIRDALAEIEDGDARCVVFEGAGDVFCAGGDISSMEESLEGDVAPDDRAREIEAGMSLMAEIRRFTTFTIAKLDGPAVGAGAALAIACDLQVASDDLVMGFVFRNVGLAVDNGVSYMLPRIVGENRAKELVATGRIVGAEEAADLGLVTHLFEADEFEERADEVVRTIAEGPTVALEHDTELIENGTTVSLEQAIKDEAKAQAIVMETDDHREGVRAFFDGRDPEFQGR